MRQKNGGKVAVPQVIKYCKSTNSLIDDLDTEDHSLPQ